MAKDKRKAKHPLVPSSLWHGGAAYSEDNELQLRDPINQIADFLEDAGFSKTLTALKDEATNKHVEVDLEAWREFANDERSGSKLTLMQMWKGIASEERLRTFNDCEERAKADTEEERELASLSEDSEQASGGALLDMEAEETDGDSSDDSSDSSSDSGSVKVGQKRKRVLTPSSSGHDSSDSDSDSESNPSSIKMKDAASSSDSSSDSDSDSESSEDEDRPLVKRAKLSQTEEEPAKAGASSDSDDDKPLVKKPKPVKADLDKHELSSDSDSDSSSDSSSDSKASLKSKSSPDSSSLSSDSGSSSSSSSSSSSGSSSNSDSESGSSSSSSSDDSSNSSSSDSDSSSSPSSPSPKKSMKPKKMKFKPKGVSSKATKPASNSGGSTSSATLVGDNQTKVKEENKKPKIKETDTLLVADTNSQIGTKAIPATKENVMQLKKEQIPFSRIPTDTKIDPKFGSNRYVSYDYADRAYQDLSVTKGKGFTKEKNKKKRGAYRGGAIDLAPKAIKFDD